MSSESEPGCITTSLGYQEQLYQDWCREHRLDPEDTQTAVAYEDDRRPWDDDEEDYQ